MSAESFDDSGEITTIKALFDLPGLYVWHCHILEHEDNDMMRPFVVSGRSGRENYGTTPSLPTQ